MSVVNKISNNQLQITNDPPPTPPSIGFGGWWYTNLKIQYGMLNVVDYNLAESETYFYTVTSNGDYVVTLEHVYIDDDTHATDSIFEGPFTFGFDVVGPTATSFSAEAMRYGQIKVNCSFGDPSGVLNATLYLHKVNGANNEYTGKTFALPDGGPHERIFTGLDVGQYRVQWGAQDNAGNNSQAIGYDTYIRYPPEYPPMPFSITQLSATSVEVRWGTGDQPGIEIGYDLNVWIEGGDTLINADVGNIHSKEFTVPAGSTVHAKVRGYSSGGDGAYNQTNLTLSTEVPGLANNLRVSERAPASTSDRPPFWVQTDFTAAWEDPANLATAPVSEWELQVFRKSDNLLLQTLSIPGAQRSVEVSNYWKESYLGQPQEGVAPLPNDTEITLKLRGKGVAGWGEYRTVSEWTWRTSSSIEPLVISNRTTTGFDVAWTQATGDGVLSYSVGLSKVLVAEEFDSQTIDINPGDPDLTVVPLPVNDTNHSITGLEPLALYFLSVDVLDETPGSGFNLRPYDKHYNKNVWTGPSVTFPAVGHFDMQVQWGGYGLAYAYEEPEYKISHFKIKIEADPGDNNTWNTTLVDDFQSGNQRPVNQTSHALANLNTNTNHRITVAAFSDGVEVSRTVSTQRTLVYAPPSWPTNLTASEIATESFRGSWDAAQAGTSPIARYEVGIYEVDPGNNSLRELVYYNRDVGNVLTHLFSDPKILPSKRYRWSVQAIDTLGYVSGYAHMYTNTQLDAVPPAAPTGLKIAFMDQSSAFVTWDPKPNDPTFVEFQLSFVLKGAAKSFKKLGDATAYLITGLEYGRAYDVDLQSVDLGNNASRTSKIHTHSLVLVKRGYPRYDLNKRAYPVIESKRAWPRDSRGAASPQGELQVVEFIDGSVVPAGWETFNDSAQHPDVVSNGGSLHGANWTALPSGSSNWSYPAKLSKGYVDQAIFDYRAIFSVDWNIQGAADQRLRLMASVGSFDAEMELVYDSSSSVLKLWYAGTLLLTVPNMSTYKGDLEIRKTSTLLEFYKDGVLITSKSGLPNYRLDNIEVYFQPWSYFGNVFPVGTMKVDSILLQKLALKQSP